MIGVAVGLTVTTMVFWPCRLLVIRKLSGVSVRSYVRQLTPAATGSAVMVVAVLIVEGFAEGRIGELSLLISEVVIGIVVYGLTLSLVDRPSVNELLAVLRSITSGVRPHR